MSGNLNIPHVGGLVDPVAVPAVPGSPQASPAQAPVDPAAFRRALTDQAALNQRAIRFSNHAMQRLERRALSPTGEQLARLGSGVDLAHAKGSRSSVVMVDDLAFVVAVPSRTVVTAIDRDHMKEQIFTNVDSAVIA